MANNYVDHEHVPGATEAERLTLKTLIAIETIEGAGITHHMYYKFVKGLRVPYFVREKIMDYVHEKSKNLENMAKKSRRK